MPSDSFEKMPNETLRELIAVDPAGVYEEALGADVMFETVLLSDADLNRLNMLIFSAIRAGKPLTRADLGGLATPEDMDIVI